MGITVDSPPLCQMPDQPEALIEHDPCSMDPHVTKGLAQ